MLHHNNAHVEWGSHIIAYSTIFVKNNIVKIPNPPYSTCTVQILQNNGKSVNNISDNINKLHNFKFTMEGENNKLNFLDIINTNKQRKYKNLQYLLIISNGYN